MTLYMLKSYRILHVKPDFQGWPNRWWKNTTKNLPPQSPCCKDLCIIHPSHSFWLRASNLHLTIVSYHSCTSILKSCFTAAQLSPHQIYARKRERWDCIRKINVPVLLILFNLQHSSYQRKWQYIQTFFFKLEEHADCHFKHAPKVQKSKIQRKRWGIYSKHACPGSHSHRAHIIFTQHPPAM